MTITISSPITGGAQTGLTSPTYTVVQDTPPNSRSEQVAVTALGGTQTGVSASTVSSPFTLTFEKPANFKQPGTPNPVTGVLSNVGRNRYVTRTRKGVLPLAGQQPSICIIETTMSIPAGADTADPLSIEAALSLHIGALNQQSAGLGDLLKNGIM